jgi:hypothetical protein
MRVVLLSAIGMAALGQRVFAFLAASAGGTVGTWFYIRRQKCEVRLG